MQNISVSQSFDKRKQSQDILLIDVRTPAEYGSIHANGAVNHPMESLELEKIPFFKEQEIHVICQSGGRSMKVSKKTGGCRIYKYRKCRGWDFGVACGRVTG
ncbi:MAG: rhodanese-like domain-containing protein [Verrucomicrobiota bacterium]|nr:rhodanese-like domain-containing protein [Verrucomicrobiota bacterium]